MRRPMAARHRLLRRLPAPAECLPLRGHGQRQDNGDERAGNGQAEERHCLHSVANGPVRSNGRRLSGRRRMYDLLTRTISQGLQAFLPIAFALTWFRRAGEADRVAGLRWGMVAALPATLAAMYGFQRSTRQSLVEAVLAAATLLVAIWFARRVSAPPSSTPDGSARRHTAVRLAFALAATLIIVRQTMEIAVAFWRGVRVARRRPAGRSRHRRCRLVAGEPAVDTTRPAVAGSRARALDRGVCRPLRGSRSRSTCFTNPPKRACCRGATCCTRRPSRTDPTACTGGTSAPCLPGPRCDGGGTGRGPAHRKTPPGDRRCQPRGLAISRRPPRGERRIDESSPVPWSAARADTASRPGRHRAQS